MTRHRNQSSVSEIALFSKVILKFTSKLRKHRCHELHNFTQRVRPALLVVGTGLAIVALAIIVIKYRRDTAGMSTALFAQNQDVIEVTTRMAEFRSKGQFDEAVELGLHSVKGQPVDDYLFHTIATVYFVRALHDKNQGGKWTRLGAEYSEKALAANPTDVANVFNVGVNYMVVGDDLDTGGCEYYRKALAVFEGLAPRLQGEHAETQGRTVQLAPFRRRNEEYRSRLRSRLRSC